MLSDLAYGTQVYLVTGYTDLRRSIDGLATIVQGQLELDPFCKGLFLFCGIVHYNSKRKSPSVTYTKEMLEKQVKPYPNKLWDYGKTIQGANLIYVDSEMPRMTFP